VWVPAHYRWTPAGYVFIDGYWDLPLDGRGVLFAPVAFSPAYLARPAFVYTPVYVVPPQPLVTSLFIRRPYDWRVVDVLLTNFHLPRTTLLLMIDAFVGPRWRDLYATALAEQYRFLSFGDAMLLQREWAA